MNKNDFYKQLIKQAETTYTPVIVHYELTSRCNFDCKMCYVHTLDHRKAFESELSTDQWKKIFDDAIEAGMIHATLSGGECLLRQDFKELYLYLFQRSIQIDVLTNGYLLNSDMISFLKQYKPSLVQISLYGASDAEYYSATGVTAFSKLKSNLDELDSSDIPFRIAITPSIESKDFVNHIIDYVIDKKYRYQITQLYISPREDAAYSGSQLSPSDICGYLEYNALKKNKQLIPVAPQELPSPGTCGEIIPELHHCNAGRNRCLVDARGIMHPCAALPDISADLNEMSYTEAWKIICEKVKLLRYPEKCSTCYYKNVCKPCYASRGIDSCNEFTCELLCRKIVAGLTKLPKN